MSSYSSSRVTITPAGRILQQIATSGCALFDLTRPVIGSTDLAAHAQVIRDAHSLDDMQTAWASLTCIPGALNALEQAAPDELATFTASLDRAGFEGRAVDFTAERIVDVLDTTVDLLRADEREVTAAALRSALTDLGYTVSTGHGERANSLAAFKDDHVIAAVVRDGGATEIDTAGLSGTGCAGPLAALDAALRARGVHLQIEHRIDHGDRDGGTLIQRAAKANTSDLAAGLVATVATVDNGRGAPARATRAGRRTQTVGGAR